MLALGVGAALGGWAWHEKQPEDSRRLSDGRVLEHASPSSRRSRSRRRSRAGRALEVQWPTYGYDMQRTHLAPDWRNLRPPYHGLWKLKARADIEFPPSVAYGKVYVAQQKGRFFAVNARTGKIVWTKHFPNCSAASPTIADGIVYQAYMHELPCRKHASGAPRASSSPGTRRNGRELLARERGLGRVVAAPRRQDALLRLLGPPPLRVPDPRQAATAPPVDVQRRRPDRRRSGRARGTS